METRLHVLLVLFGCDRMITGRQVCNTVVLAVTVQGRSGMGMYNLLTQLGFGPQITPMLAAG